jgi:hypothetical protein
MSTRFFHENTVCALENTALFVTGILGTLLLCAYLFTRLHAFSYRLVLVFLALVFLSNLGADFFLSYVEQKI